jgi:hypothetical protein
MNDDGLQRRIDAALQAEPSAEQLARLEAFWRQRSRAERRRRLVGRAAAMAACLAAVGGALAWMMREAPHEAPAVVVQRQSPALPESKSGGRELNTGESPQLADSPAEVSTPSSPLAGRPATEYERFMFALSTQQSVDAQQVRLKSAVDAAISQLVDQPETDAAAVAEVNSLEGPNAEQLLLERLTGGSEPEQAAVVRLLSTCGTTRSTPALLALGGGESLQANVVQTLETIVGVDNLAGAVRQAPHRGLRTALLRRMFTAGSDEALRGFLSLIPHKTLGAEALTVADGVDQPPTGALMKLLEDDAKPARLAAAVVLGHMNGPEVTAALIELVTDRPSASAEAWVALLACRGESADRFLAVASQEPRWLGHVNNARITWARMVQ